MPEPEDFATFKDSAIAMHEVFISLTEAGFTESQALKLIANILVAKQEDNDAGA